MSNLEAEQQFPPSYEEVVSADAKSDSKSNSDAKAKRAKVLNVIVNALLALIVVLLLFRISKCYEGFIKSDDQVVTGVSPYILNAMSREGMQAGSDVRQITDIDLAGKVWAGL